MSLVRSAPMTSHRKSSGFQKGLIYLALLLCTLLFLAPLLGNVLLALKNISELAAFPVHILPAHWEWGNFLQALTLIPFGQYLINPIGINDLQLRKDDRHSHLCHLCAVANH